MSIHMYVWTSQTSFTNMYYKTFILVRNTNAFDTPLSNI